MIFPKFFNPGPRLFPIGPNAWELNDAAGNPWTIIRLDDRDYEARRVITVKKGRNRLFGANLKALSERVGALT